MAAWTLIYYETEHGRCPVQEYIDALDGKEAARLTYGLDLLEAFGIALGEPHTKGLGGKLWELRVVGRRQHRVLYFAVSGRRFVLLHAFTGKRRKTPAQEIQTGMARMADYIRRFGNETS